MPPPRWPAWSTTSPTGTCAAAAAASGVPIPTRRPGDTLAAQATLHEVLTTLSLLLAPFCPFVADAMWRALSGADETRVGAPGRLAHARRRTSIDRDLEAQMELARRLTSLGRAARSEAGVKVRQPLSRALVFLPPGAPAILHDIVAEELNVDEIDVADELSEVLQFELVAELPHPRAPPEGAGRSTSSRRWPRSTASRRRPRSRRGSRSRSTCPAAPVELGPDDVQLRVRGQQGFAVSREGGEVVALDLTLDDALRHRGLAREVVRLVQDLRKNSGLDVSDRIHLHLEGLDMIEEHFDYIAREVLAVSIVTGPGEGEGTVLELETDEGAIHGAGLAAQGGRPASSAVAADGRRPGLSSCGARAWTAPASARRGPSSFERRHEVAVDPLDVLADGLPRVACPAGVRTTWTLRRSDGQFWRATRPASTMRSTSRVTPPVVSATSALSLLMVRRPSSAPADVDEHVEPDQGDADGLLELAARADR